MKAHEVIVELKKQSDLASLEGMRRFGIDTSKALGVKIPALRELARRIKRDHTLALALWQTDIHEARILASMIDDPGLVTIRQISEWVKDFNSWDLCDQVCGNLFDKTKHAVDCTFIFTESKKEFIKRAGFVLMAEYAVHDKIAPDKVFIDFLPVIEKHAGDERNFVKKAVNWALRQIGKRNAALRIKAIETADRIHLQDSSTAKWIAKDALRELNRLS